MKKYYLTLLVIAIFAVGFISSDEDSSSSSSTENQEQVQGQQPPKPDFLGTYAVRDKAGIVYHFVFKEDGTVDVFGNADNPKIRKLMTTGKWGDERNTKYGLQICYNKRQIPNLVYPYGEKVDLCAYICEGYYYPGWAECDDRDEAYRLEAIKIE